MSEATKNSWVWRSTDVSRAARQVSVLAVAETLVCVALYWVLLLWLGVTWHHWMILIATPLVLLRSEQSMALGVKWFSTDAHTPGIPLRSLKGVGVIAISAIVAGLAGWALARYWIAGTTGWALYVKMAVIGWLGLNLATVVTAATAPVAAQKTVTVAAAVAAAVTVTAPAVPAVDIVTAAVTATAAAAVTAAAAASASPAAAFMAVLPGIGFGVLLRAILIRLTATARFLIRGLVQFPTNWRFSTIESDLFHPPELIPGNEGIIYGKAISLALRKRDGTRNSASGIIANTLLLFIFFGPVMLWRWAVKSTAWFYLPLLWVRRGWQQLDREELQIWARSYSSKALNWVWLVLGLISIAAVTVTLFSLHNYLALQQQLNQTGAPTTFLGFLYALEWSELLELPWLWFYLPSYVLTVIIFFALDGIAKDIRHGDARPETRAALMQKWMWAANARAVLTNTGLAVALWYFLDAVDAWEKVKALTQGLV